MSNLTNLLAFKASGLSFARFGAIMALPWLAAIAVEWVVIRRFFASDLVGRGDAVPASPPPTPVFAVVVVLVTLVGFFVTSLLGVAPAFAALVGAIALAVPALARRRVKARDFARAVDVPFLAFVIALALVVKAVSLHGLSSVVARLMPGQVSLWSLLAVAAMAAVLANVTNNLPALLLLLPAAAAAGPPEVLAVLVGVNTGAQPHLCRLASDPALEEGPAPTRRGAAHLRVPPLGCRDGAAGAGCRHRGPVGVVEIGGMIQP